LQKEPNPLNVPKKMYEKFQTAVADMMLYREDPRAFLEEYEVKLPPPKPVKPTVDELKALAANERLKSREQRLLEIEIKRVKRMEEREQQRKERDRLRKEREEARAQISRNVCLQVCIEENQNFNCIKLFLFSAATTRTNLQR